MGHALLKKAILLHKRATVPLYLSICVAPCWGLHCPWDQCQPLWPSHPDLRVSAEVVGIRNDLHRAPILKTSSKPSLPSSLAYRVRHELKPNGFCIWGKHGVNILLRDCA